MTIIFHITSNYSQLIQNLHHIIPHMNRFCIERRYLEQFELIDDGFLHVFDHPDAFAAFLHDFEVNINRSNFLLDNTIPLIQLFKTISFPVLGIWIAYECGNEEDNSCLWLSKMQPIFQKIPNLQITNEEHPTVLRITFQTLESFLFWAQWMNRRYL